MLLRCLWEKKWFIALYIVIFTVSSVSMAVFNLYISPIFDDISVGKYDAAIKQLGLMFVWYVLMRLLDYYAENTAIHTINGIRCDIKKKMFRSLFATRELGFSRNNTGAYISEFTNDITVIEMKFLYPCKEMISYIITIITVCFAISSIDLIMALVIVCGALICLILPLIFTKYTSQRMLKFTECFDVFVQHLKDVFSGYFTFRNYGIEKQITENFYTKNDEVEKSKLKAELSLVVMNNIIGRFAWLIEILVVVIGLIGVIHEKLTIGSVFSAYMLAGNLGIPLQSLGNRISMIRSVKGVEKKLSSMMKNKSELVSESKITAEIKNPAVVFENVSLSIDGNLILDNISHRFEFGRKYLIIGSNGSGKSTLTKLLKNNCHDYSGIITIGGYDLKSDDGCFLAEKVSYSNEMVSLFDDTVRNNILMYREVQEDVLESVVKDTGLSVALERKVGDEGADLSSGEKRRIEICRSLIDNPSIMIFDEVISTLDIETAYEIEKLIISLENRTVIMISNCFTGSILDCFDEIILMDSGKIREYGTHRELLEKSEEYSDLYNIRCGRSDIEVI